MREGVAFRNGLANPVKCFFDFFSLPPPRHRPEREDLDFGTTVVWDTHPRRLASSRLATTYFGGKRELSARLANSSQTTT